MKNVYKDLMFNPEVFTLTWKGKRYSSAKDYYREVVLTETDADNKLNYAIDHFGALTALGSEVYLMPLDQDQMWVGDWLVSYNDAHHKHAQFGVLSLDGPDMMGPVVADVVGGSCALCGERIPGDINMVHKLHKL